MKVLYLKILLLYVCVLAVISKVHSNPAKFMANGSNKHKRQLRLNSLPYEDCGSKYDILYLSISSCSQIPCTMQRGSTVRVNVIFDDDGSNISFLKNHVRWVFNAVKTEATISPDPCDGVQQCIMSISSGKSYTTTVYVNDSLPVMGGSMVWMAENAHNENVLCFRVPVIISLY